MTSNPFFSIVIPAYNRAHMIGHTIGSVLKQTYTDWELVIVDDGSKDDTKEVVLAYNEPRIKYIYQTNAERSAARNNGIKNSTGKYITFVDSDDYYLPRRLEMLHSSIKEKGEPVALFYTDIAFDKHGVFTDKFAGDNKGLNIHDFIATAVLGNPQMCAHRDVFLKHQFNPKFRIGEDMELLHRMLDEYPAIYLPNQLTVVAGDHDDRSVNEKKYNSFAEHKQTLDFVFAPTHPGSKTNAELKANKYCDCYFGIARYHIYNKQRGSAVYWLLKSIMAKPGHPQTKYKLNLIRHVLLNPAQAIKLLQG